MAAIAVSTLLHVALFGLVLNHFMGAPSGGGGQMLDAIEIEVIGGDALESATATAGKAAGTAATSDVAGSTAAMSSQAQTSAPAMAAQAAAAPQPMDARDADLPAPSPLVVPPLILPPLEVQPPEVPVATEVRIEIAVPTPSIDASSAASPAADAGGSTAAASVPAAPTAASAAASPGEVVRFNTAVRKALSSQRPKRGWPSGRVLLAFSVSDAGRVENAELVQASADTRLNRLTLEWIAAVAMPTPPSGLPLADRRYSIPLTVK